MNCIKCGSPKEADQVCEKCKQAEAVSGKIVESSPASGRQERTVASPPISTWAALRIALAATVAFLLAFMTYGKTVSGEFIGYWVGSLLLPFGIAYLIAGRASRRDWNKFSWLFLLLGTVLPAIAHSGSIRYSAVKPETRVAEALRVATGAKKAEFSGTPADQEMQRLLNAVMSRVLGYRQEHNAKIAAVNNDLKQLYSANSFSSKEEISRSLSAINKTLDADEELDRNLEHWQDGIKKDLEHSSLPDSEKQEFLNGVTKGLTGSEMLPLRRQATAAEKEWAISSRDLYEFALANRQHIIAKQDKLVIDDEKIRSDFSARLRHSLELRDQVSSFNKQIAQKQAQVGKQFGVKPEELGVKN